MNMRFVHNDGDTLQLNWMWLPAFIAHNYLVIGELEAELRKRYYGKLATPSQLDEIHDFIVNWLDQRFHISGLGEYLQAVRFVHQDEADEPIHETASQ